VIAPVRLLADRAQFRVARRLESLPARLRRRIAGPPIVVDGPPLDPGLQLLLALRSRLGYAPLSELAPPVARLRTRRDAAGAVGAPVAVGAVTELTVAGASSPLPARHYAPTGDGTRPLLVFLHGGGFVLCDVDTHDQVCRTLCRYADVHVLSVGYRLAPEDPFPAAVEDSWAALRWAAANAERLGADPGRLAIGGDSAGGNLSAVTAQRAAREGGPDLALQVLLYPAVDRTTPYPSLDLFSDGFYLTREEISWFQLNYSPAVDLADPRISPLLADDLRGVAPSLVVTAGFDPLRDEGEAYAAALAGAGVEVRLRREPSLIHGFANMADLNAASHAALLEIAAEVGTALLSGSQLRFDG
jgi:acetyl esterase